MSVEGITSRPVAAEIEAEFAGIGLLGCDCRAAKASPAGVVEELDVIAQRMNGPKAVHLATEPVVAAYRALRVGLGMEADAGIGTVEDLARRRLIEGGYRTEGLPADAVLIATIETGVPIQILDASDAETSLGIDPTTGLVTLMRGGEAAAALFGEPASAHALSRKAMEAELVAVVAPGVLPEVVAMALDRARSLAAVQ